MKRTCYLCKAKAHEQNMHSVTINHAKGGWTPTKYLVCHYCYTNSHRVVR